MIFVMSGPSGSGKTTLRDQLLQDRELKKYLVKSVSFTTRKARSAEKNKKDYLFVSEIEFKRLLSSKKILEWTKYLGYYYATSKDFLDRQLKSKKSIILCLDLKGALTIKKLYAQNCVTIFILPPSISALQKRIEGRCNKTEKEEICRRLESARQELAEAGRYDYCIVNKNLTQAIRELKGIVLESITQRRR
jgi:guanylate kinase